MVNFWNNLIGYSHRQKLESQINKTILGGPKQDSEN